MPTGKPPKSIIGELMPSNRENYLKKEAKKNGRPRTTLKKLPADWEELMLNCAKQGKGPTSYRVVLGINNHAFATLLEDSESFRSVYMQCQDICAEWYEDRGREMITGDVNGSASVWSINMSNRFGWSSAKQNHQTNVVISSDKKDLTLDQIKEKLRERQLPTDFLDD